MKKLILVFLVLGAIIIYGFQSSRPQPKEIHNHAGFQVYKDDKLVDFSDLKYMNLEPCGKHEEKEDEQMEKAHLHDMVGDVVHVHRPGARWSDLFKNINYTLPQTVIGYVDGKKVDSILNTEIKPYQSAIFFLGKNSQINSKLKNAVKKDHILSVEKKSETCGTDSH